MSSFTIHPSLKSSIKFIDGSITVQVIKIDDVFQDCLEIDEFIQNMNRILFHLHDLKPKSYQLEPESSTNDEVQIVKCNKFPTLEIISNEFVPIYQIEFKTNRGTMTYSSNDLMIQLSIDLNKEDYDKLVEAYGED